MKMRTGVVALLILLVCVSGCGLNSQAIRTEEYPSVKRMFDVTFGWRSSVTENGMVVDGYVRNTRYYLITDMDMTVSLLGPDGREKAANSFLFIPERLPMDDYSGFSVELKAHPQPGDKLQFHYRYIADDARDGGFSWVNSFLVPAIGEGMRH